MMMTEAEIGEKLLRLCDDVLAQEEPGFMSVKVTFERGTLTLFVADPHTAEYIRRAFRICPACPQFWDEVEKLAEAHIESHHRSR